MSTFPVVLMLCVVWWELRSIRRELVAMRADLVTLQTAFPERELLAALLNRDASLS